MKILRDYFRDSLIETGAASIREREIVRIRADP
jgi:hypothetical protein